MMIGSASLAAAAPSTVQALLTKFSFSIDGQEQNLKSDPLVYNGKTYLPVRDVAEITGYDLKFDNKTKSIELKSKSSLIETSTPTLDEAKEKQIKINETVTQDNMTLKLKGLSYADFIPYEPGAAAGSYPQEGYKFAVIDFEILINAEPKGKFDWYSIDFFDFATVNGKKIDTANAFADYNVSPNKLKSVQITVSIPKELTVSSISFKNPSSNKSFGVADIQ